MRSKSSISREDLEVALSRERMARNLAEDILEKKTSTLFKINKQLNDQYMISAQRNLEFEYLSSLAELDNEDLSFITIFNSFLQITAKLIWADFSFCIQKENNTLVPIYICSLDGEPTDFQQNTKNIDFNTIPELNNLKNYIKISQPNNNYSYFFPLNTKEDNSYLFLFMYNKNYDISNENIILIQKGLSLINTFIVKNNAKKELLENFNRIKEIKTQLIQSEKMASLGTISAGIAHEINNPLSFLLTNIEVLSDYLKTIDTVILSTKIELDPNIKYILEDIPNLMNESLTGISRIKDIVAGLRTFSRADDGILQKISINDCIETSIKLVSNELKHKCKLTLDLDKSNPKIFGSHGQLIQVFTNLLVNSAQAIQENGCIKIKSSIIHNNIIIEISDSGVGISKENISKLFTPFFTTKPTGQGTGLGLSISYGILQKHNAKISVESELNVGTTFFITVPMEKSA